MVYKNTLVRNIDNSGAIIVKCIHILNRGPKSRANIGDILIVIVKTYRANKKVKKKEMFKAVVVRTRYKKKRVGGFFINGTTSAVILLNKQGNPLGTRILGPVFKEVKKVSVGKKILSMATAIV